MKIVTGNKENIIDTNIVYDGGLDELNSLIDPDGEVNNDKLLDWLLNSENITHTPETLKVVKSEARKRKIKKIDKK